MAILHSVCIFTPSVFYAKACVWLLAKKHDLRKICVVLICSLLGVIIFAPYICALTNQQNVFGILEGFWLLNAMIDRCLWCYLDIGEGGDQ